MPKKICRWLGIVSQVCRIDLIMSFLYSPSCLALLNLKKEVPKIWSEQTINRVRGTAEFCWKLAVHHAVWRVTLRRGVVTKTMAKEQAKRNCSSSLPRPPHTKLGMDWEIIASLHLETNHLASCLNCSIELQN